ncbi:hypothetical protein ACFYXS_02745 [Streptomyces sp. NPDC002574]|uniref:hypothetical protein n=1 Tax=Streptomyces sp. NPDC002574 TaxID=3364652 RepID=UPI0036AD226B
MLTALADALTKDPEAVMDLGVLLGLIHEASEGDEERIHQLLSQAPEITEGATRGEYALKLRLIEMGVTP